MQQATLYKYKERSKAYWFNQILLRLLFWVFMASRQVFCRIFEYFKVKKLLSPNKIDWKGLIQYGAPASDVQRALNDLPLLYPNLTNVTEELDADGVSKNYIVSFSVDLGDVPDLEEVGGLVNATITQLNDTKLNGKKSYLLINDVPTNLFDLKDTAANVKSK